MVVAIDANKTSQARPVRRNDLMTDKGLIVVSVATIRQQSSLRYMRKPPEVEHRTVN